MGRLLTFSKNYEILPVFCTVIYFISGEKDQTYDAIAHVLSKSRDGVTVCPTPAKKVAALTFG